MAQQTLANSHGLTRLVRFLGVILGPEKNYYALAIIYGIGISLLTLATPISVQMLINTVAYTGLITPLVLLSLSLFVLLLFASLLNALRIHLMDLFQRRFYARMVSEVALRSIYAVNPFFEDSGKGTLFNRYFDIIIVQKTLPNILVGGFTILLQTIVGMVLVSLYHPLFMVFNLVVLLAVWLVWTIWGKRAMASAVELSHRKHATASWLEGLGSSNGFFKSERHIDDALDQTDAVTGHYIDQHKLHFRHHFSQTLWFLFIYATASALLLGLGGWLVIIGELTLGQLVAAELVLSVIFFSISQLGLYLTYFYDVCGAVDELSLFYDVEQEDFVPPDKEPPREQTKRATELAFVGARGDARGVETILDFRIPGGSRTLVHTEGHAAQRVFGNFLKGHERPQGGFVSLGGEDLQAIAPHTLRQQLIVLDRPNIIESTIREFLTLSADGARPEAIIDAIDAVGLEATIRELHQGLDTRITASGWPLAIAEAMQLKLASSIIARPRVLVLNQLYDVLPAEALRRSFDLLKEMTNDSATVLFISNHEPELDFDSWLRLDTREQEVFETRGAFRASFAGGSTVTQTGAGEELLFTLGKAQQDN